MSCTTHIFGTIGTLELEIDVYPPLIPQTNGNHHARHAHSDAETGAPVILMLHGGGFMCGDKTFHPPVVVDYLRRQGFFIVSPNYPLAPCGTIFDQVEAVKLAWSWIGADDGLRGAVADAHFDVKRIIAWGGSAAATLLLLSVEHLHPRPRALILPYPYVDLTRPKKVGTLKDLGADNVPWVSDPSELVHKIMCKGMIQSSPWSDFLRLMTVSEPIKAIDLHPNTLYLFETARQPPAFAAVVTGHIYARILGQGENQLMALPEWFVRRSDVFQVGQWGKMPPMIVLQGNSDSVTPAKSTREFVDQARAKGNQVDLLETHVNGGKHVFDFHFQSSDEPGFARTIGAAVDFIWQALAEPKDSAEVNGH